MENKTLKYSSHLMAFILLILILSHLIITEKPSTTGSDPAVYVSWIQNHENILNKGKITSERIHKILPVGIVLYSLKLLDQPLSIANIHLFFEILDLLFIIMASYTCYFISNHLNISSRGRWLLFVAIFFNYGIMKYYMSVSILTDIMGYTIITLLVYFYIKNKTLALWITTVIGTFCWAPLMYAGLILMAFPRLKYPLKQVIPSFKLLTIPVALICGLIFLDIIKLTLGQSKELNLNLVLSGLSTLLYISFSSKELFRHEYFLKNSWSILYSYRKSILLSGITFITIKVFIIYISHPGGFALFDFFEQVLVDRSLVKPFGYFIDHVQFYGPLLILTVLLWRSISQITHQYGVGLIFFFLFSILFSLNTESRHSVHSFPILAIFTVKALENLKLRPYFYWIIMALGLFYSQIWWGYGSIRFIGKEIDPIISALPSMGRYGWIPFLFPPIPYMVQSSMIIFLGILFYFMIRQSRART